MAFNQETRLEIKSELISSEFISQAFTSLATAALATFKAGGDFIGLSVWRRLYTICFCHWPFLGVPVVDGLKKEQANQRSDYPTREPNKRAQQESQRESPEYFKGDVIQYVC